MSTELVSFVCAEFLAGSVLHRALDISLPEYSHYMAEPICALLQQENSFVAIDEADQTVAGCILAGDFRPTETDQQVHDKPVPEFARPINALLNSLEQQYESQRPLNSTQATLLVDIAVVAPRARGQGLYTRLREAVHKRALQRGYTSVVGELSSVATQHLCVEKLGHRVICEIPYRSFEFDGQYPFASIKEPASIQLVEGAL